MRRDLHDKQQEGQNKVDCDGCRIADIIKRNKGEKRAGCKSDWIHQFRICTSIAYYNGGYEGFAYDAMKDADSKQVDCIWPLFTYNHPPASSREREKRYYITAGAAAHKRC